MTSTTPPYLFHIPTILSLTDGLPYWFRYQNSYLDETIANAKNNQYKEREGILYLRDNESELKLCYPIRKFTVIWHENDGYFSYFYVRLDSIVTYQEIKISPLELQRGNNLQKIDDRNQSNILNEIIERSKKRKDTPANFNKTTVPKKHEPHLLTDNEIRFYEDLIELKQRSSPVDKEKLVWLINESNKKSNNKNINGKNTSENEENRKWSSILRAFLLISAFKKLIFTKINVIKNIQKPKKKYLPKDFREQKQKKDKTTNFNTFNTVGYYLEPGSSYSLAISEVVPYVFENENYTFSQSHISIENSDPEIIGINKKEIIDGFYGRYELTFLLKKGWSIHSMLLRVDCIGEKVSLQQQQNNNETYNLPSAIIPIRIPRIYKWRTRITATIITLALVMAYVFHKDIVNLIDAKPPEYTYKIVEVILLSLTLLSAEWTKNSYVGDFIQD